MPNGRCRMHGGKSPIGIGSATLTANGRYSKHLPTRLAASYAEAQNDPDLLNLRSEISLLDSRAADVLSGVSNGESGELWKRLKEALRAYDKAKPDEKGEAFGTIRWLINEGYQEWMSWMEIRHIIQERRSLVDSERGRLKDMQQMISAERANILLGAIVNVIKRNVTDRGTLAAIASDLRDIVNTRHSESD